MNNIYNYNNSYINRRNLNRRNSKKIDKANLIELEEVDEIHGVKCLFGDDNPPFWQFECGGYICNNCSYKIVSNVKKSENCPKCQKELKVFKFCNRYVKSEENTLIDLKDVNVSVLEFEDDKENKENKQSLPKNNIDDNECREALKNVKDEDGLNSKREKDIGRQTCQICFVLKSTKKINCDSTAEHLICSYCYNRMIKIDKIRLCPFCRTKIKEKDM